MIQWVGIGEGIKQREDNKKVVLASPLSQQIVHLETYS
jgi:hypothetical protein